MFHDLWSIAGQHVFEAAVLQRAVIQTFSRRNTTLPNQTPTAFTPDFVQDPTKQQVWAAFLGRAGRGGYPATPAVSRALVVGDGWWALESSAVVLGVVGIVAWMTSRE